MRFVERHADVFAVGIAMLVTALRAAIAWKLSFPVEGDYFAYYTMAQRLVEGMTIKDQLGNLAYYNVGYALVLAGPFALFGPSIGIAWLLNALLGGASTYLVYRLTARITDDRGCGLFAAVVWALYIEGYVYGAYVAKENLSAVLFLWQCLLITRFAERTRKRATAFTLGGLTGLQALVGSSALAIVPLLLWLVWRASRPAHATQAVVVFIAAFGLVIAPWLARNQIELGAPVLNSNGGFNLYLGNNPVADGYYRSIGDTPLAEQWHDWRARGGELYADRAAGAAARDYMFAHPGETLKLAAKKAFLFWQPPLHEGKRSVHGAEQAARVLWAVEYCALIVFALIGLRALPNNVRTNTIPIWLFVLCYALLHSAFYIIFRYRYPIMPLVTVLAASAAYALAVRVYVIHLSKQGVRERNSAIA